MAKLTKADDIFCREYIIDFNGTRSYMAAHPKVKENSAGVSASNLLRNAKIQKRLSELLKPKCDTLDITAERVLNELARCAFLNPKNLFNADGSLKSIHEMDDDTAVAINGIENEAIYQYSDGKKNQIGNLKKIKLVDKKGSLELLGKYLKLFTDIHEITGPGGGPIQTLDLSKLKDDELERIIRILKKCKTD